MGAGENGRDRIESFIQKMPKVEIHVHLEGAIRPETFLRLASRHGVPLPATTVEGLRDWFQFTDFRHFIEVYLAISSSIRTPDDIELVAREFLQGQADQNIVYTEATWTPHTHYEYKGLSFREQFAALNRARKWGRSSLGVEMALVLDIPRVVPEAAGIQTAEWACEGFGDGVVALGLGGPEAGNPPERYRAAFDLAHANGVPSVPHAGEMAGPESIRGALDTLRACRIGHGVRCLEDPDLVDRLREEQIPLEVCPTSNVCLGVASSFAEHPLPRMMDEGLYVTLNSDDPPLFDTTLTDEYLKASEAFGLGEADLERLVSNAANAALIPAAGRAVLVNRVEAGFALLRDEKPR